MTKVPYNQVTLKGPVPAKSSKLSSHEPAYISDHLVTDTELSVLVQKIPLEDFLR